jgi:endonuclease/exonuclease/phosphatase family metal-dependent hydrolase
VATKFLVLISVFLSFAAHSSFIVKSYNIRNFASAKSTNLSLLKKILLDNQADIIAVQEIKNAKLFKTFIENELKIFDYKAVISKCGGAGNQKLGFIYNSKRLKLKSFTEDLSLTGKSPSCNGSSRPAAIGLFKDQEDQQDFVAISLHLKAGGCSKCISKRKFQLKQLSRIIKKVYLSGLENIIAMGDFNTTEYNKDGQDQKYFKGFVAHHLMRDTAEKIKCSSYWGGNNRGDGIEEPSMLDHILITKSFMQKYSQAKASVALHCRKNHCKRTPSQKMGMAYKQVSDHCPISLDMR